MSEERDQDLLTSSYHYDLPLDLIAHRPLDRRDQSRLMVLCGHEKPQHRIFSDLPDYLKAGDCLVINDTRVIPARLYGEKAKTGGAVEFLLLGQTDQGLWRVLAKPGKNARPGQVILFGGGRLEARVQSLEPDGNRLVSFQHEGDFMSLIQAIGVMPLPPYIHEKLEDPDRYQTVYANQPGSAAAPTAGLHFTKAMLESLEASGIALAKLTLEVGLGTFRPVKEARITDHLMHRERFSLSQDAVDTILSARQRGGRVFAVGTTSCRVLESVAHGLFSSDVRGGAEPQGGLLRASRGETDLFIYPGFDFKVVDALITNFHLPDSTLLMLVSALMGRETILAAYREAVEEAYRFFSFGDAMLLIPDSGKKE